MNLNYNWLLEDGTLDKRYGPILLKIYKDSVREYHTTWLVRCGILTVEELTDYLNKRPENKLTYIIPKLPEGEQYLNLEELIDNQQIRATFANVCMKYKLFPYRTVGATMTWLAEEREDEMEDGTPTVE